MLTNMLTDTLTDTLTASTGRLVHISPGGPIGSAVGIRTPSGRLLVDGDRAPYALSNPANTRDNTSADISSTEAHWEPEGWNE